MKTQNESQDSLAAQRELRRQKILNKSADRLGRITNLKSNTTLENVDITFATQVGESKKNEIMSDFTRPCSTLESHESKESQKNENSLESIPLYNSEELLNTPLESPQLGKTESPSFFTFRTFLILILGIVTVYLHEQPHTWMYSPVLSVPLYYGDYTIVNF